MLFEYKTIKCFIILFDFILIPIGLRQNKHKAALLLASMVPRRTFNIHGTFSLRIFFKDCSFFHSFIHKSVLLGTLHNFLLVT